MCVVNKQFELLEFVFDSCGSPWSVCEVVSAVIAVTVMNVLLFVLHMWLLRECEGTRVTAMLVWGPGEVWLR